MLATVSLPATPELGYIRSPVINSPRPASLSSPHLAALKSPRPSAVDPSITSVVPPPQKRNAISVSPAQFREIAIAALRDVLCLLRIASECSIYLLYLSLTSFTEWKAEHKAGQDYNPSREEAFSKSSLDSQYLSSLTFMQFAAIFLPQVSSMRSTMLSTLPFPTLHTLNYASAA